MGFMLHHRTKKKAGRMSSKSCSSFPPDTYGCRTYPHEVNYIKKSIYMQPFPQISIILVHRRTFMLLVGSSLLHHVLTTVPSLPADIVDGNLKSVMRIILALAAHFKPTANHRAASGSGRGLLRGTSSHNPLSPIALAQGAAAALASARHDASQPAACVPRYTLPHV